MKRFVAFQSPPPPHPPGHREGGVREGQLYRLPPPAEVDVLWLVLYEDTEPGPENLFYLTVCDRLVGFLAETAHDTLVPADDPTFPLVVRPMMGAWVSEEFLAASEIAGVVLETTLELAQGACALAIREKPFAPIGRVTPDLKSYREYVACLVSHLRRCADYNA